MATLMRGKGNDGFINLLDATPFSLVKFIHIIIFILEVELITLILL